MDLKPTLENLISSLPPIISMAHAKKCLGRVISKRPLASVVLVPEHIPPSGSIFSHLVTRYSLRESIFTTPGVEGAGKKPMRPESKKEVKMEKQPTLEDPINSLPPIVSKDHIEEYLGTVISKRPLANIVLVPEHIFPAGRIFFIWEPFFTFGNRFLPLYGLKAMEKPNEAKIQTGGKNGKATNPRKPNQLSTPNHLTGPCREIPRRRNLPKDSGKPRFSRQGPQENADRAEDRLPDRGSSGMALT
jgi:hypothetical protein